MRCPDWPSPNSRRYGIGAVLVTPWRWDGRERIRIARPASYLLTPEEPVDV